MVNKIVDIRSQAIAGINDGLIFFRKIYFRNIRQDLIIKGAPKEAPRLTNYRTKLTIAIVILLLVTVKS